jgi:hypothetical protein
MLNGGSRALLAFGLLAWLVGCTAHQDADTVDRSAPNPPSKSVMSTTPSANQGAAGGGAGSGIAGSAGTVNGAAPNGTAAGGTPGGSAPSADGCAANLPFKKEGCPCQAGETAACWTGPAADRNVGKCHDGLQICSASGSAEFQLASWGPCMGAQLSCGTDAGVPPPPPDAGVPTPPEDCSCIPGAIIQCSEDCSVGIICSLTATKTCLPDRTWSVCREDMGVTLDLPGVQCRNMLHGCLGKVSSDGPAQSQGELYVGDCSKQFACGHAPPPDN